MLAGNSVAVNIHSLAAMHLALRIRPVFWGKLETKNMAMWAPDPHPHLYTPHGKNTARVLEGHSTSKASGGGKQEGEEKNPSVVRSYPVPSPEDTKVYQCGTHGKNFLKKRNPIAHRRKVQICLESWKEIRRDQAASLQGARQARPRRHHPQGREIHAKDKPYETFAVVYQVVQVPR